MITRTYHFFTLFTFYADIIIKSLILVGKNFLKVRPLGHTHYLKANT